MFKGYQAAQVKCFLVAIMFNVNSFICEVLSMAHITSCIYKDLFWIVGDILKEMYIRPC